MAGLSRTAVLNTNFGTSGSVSFGSIGGGQSAYATPPRLDATGRWVMKYNGLGKNTAVRLTAAGAVDNAFAGDGILDFAARMGNGGGIVPLSGGGYVVGVYSSAPMSSSTYAVRRLDNQGAIRTSRSNRA